MHMYVCMYVYVYASLHPSPTDIPREAMHGQRTGEVGNIMNIMAQLPRCLHQAMACV